MKHYNDEQRIVFPGHNPVVLGYHPETKTIYSLKKKQATFIEEPIDLDILDEGIDYALYTVNEVLEGKEVYLGKTKVVHKENAKTVRSMLGHIPDTFTLLHHSNAMKSIALKHNSPWIKSRLYLPPGKPLKVLHRITGKIFFLHIDMTKAASFNVLTAEPKLADVPELVIRDVQGIVVNRCHYADAIYLLPCFKVL